MKALGEEQLSVKVMMERIGWLFTIAYAKGFVLDDERLKGKNVFGADYFDDLLNRIILKTRTNSELMRVFL